MGEVSEVAVILEASKCILGLPRWLSDKEFACQCKRHGFDPWVKKVPWRRKWQPIPVFLPGKSHGQRSLAGYSPWGHKESDKTEGLNSDNNNKVHFQLPAKELVLLAN